jgi:uncharacterized membrane-anchored protein
MFDVVKSARKKFLRDGRRLERFCHSLWSIEGRLSVAAGFGDNKEAERMAGALGHLLVDDLEPAVSLLKRLGDEEPAEATTAIEEAPAEC